MRQATEIHGFSIALYCSFIYLNNDHGHIITRVLKGKTQHCLPIITQGLEAGYGQKI